MNKPKENRKEDIMSAALDLFVEYGYGSTKVADIVSKANVSMGLLFHYFSSKEQLYYELIKIGCQATDMNLDIDFTPIKVFEMSAKKIFDVLSKPAAAKMFVFMSTAQHNKNIPKEAKELLSKIDLIEKSVPLIEKGQNLKEIKEGNPLELAILFWSAIQGIAQEIARKPNYPCPSYELVVDILRKKSHETNL